jgi:hypothetical protein
MSFSSSSQRPDLRSDPSMSGTSSIGEASVASSSLVPLRAPVVYPALLSRVAEAFKARVIVNERLKDGLVYPDTFDGRDAVDKIAYIIKTTDRNLALLLGRALDAQKFFHDVTYDHRLRDSALELYQFKERLTAPFLSSDDLSPADDPDAAVSIDESTIPSGVFTLLTDCYSPTCTRDRLCYSIACPRRLEQQARLNLKPKPGLQRSVSSESLGDLRVRPPTSFSSSLSTDDVCRNLDRSGFTPYRKISQTRRPTRRKSARRLSMRSSTLSGTLCETWSTFET